ncbi:hypothetical protein LAV60_15395 [Clostridium sporogenes]|uniref:hypothetical protein n=1 Tax=Clostridium sporogenes TaxID=1509 RepID=UPI0022378D44|nr:hypothetical protein [Clostridium sporogenes]MCW6094555.1 hypothetical protein [Clostridium sporogenes]
MQEDVKSTPEVVEEQTPPVNDTPEDNKETTNSDLKDNNKEPETEPIKEPEKEPEKKEEPENKENEKVTGLEAEIERLKGELKQVKAKDDSKVALDQANTLLNEQKNLVAEYEGILTGIIDTKLEQIPENLKELVPANLSLKEKMDWLTKAEKSGVFKVNPDIEIGKPLNPNNIKQPTDTSKLSTSSILAMAYGNSKNRK